MGIFVVGTLDQLFSRGYSKKQSSKCQNSVLCYRSIVVLSILIALTMASDRAVLYENVAFENFSKSMYFSENLFQS